ncbi:MAG: nucleotidyltransferase family protein [Deltaproteobacteria bacterium]|nr:nucleotidyltransferase family protein [Deltaproteobacteria bacterium]
MDELPTPLRPFAAILPSGEETLLLRAGLLGDPAAWRQWQSTTQTGFIGHNPAIQKLRLLLSQAHQQHHFPMDKESQPFLRLSYFKEGLRREIYQRLFRSVLERLQQAAIPVIVLKGVALAETVYPPAMRHCHDIDLLLSPLDIALAAESVTELGFHRVAAPQPGPSVRLDHQSRLPLELHTALFQAPHAHQIAGEMLDRAQCHPVFGINATILSPEDSLLHVCAHAFSSSNRYSLRWVSDVWRIGEKHPDLDWQLILACTARAQLSVPLAVTLGYVSETLKAPLPASVIEALLDGASLPSPMVNCNSDRSL